MKWTLLVILLSSGHFQERHLDEASCREAMLLVEIVTRDDLWMAKCLGPEGEQITSVKAVGDLGP